LSAVFPSVFAEFKDNLSKKKTDYLHSLKTTIVFRKKNGQSNALKNLPYILQCESIFSYKDQFEGKTVVMTASGPSLTAAIPFLREIKEKRKALLVAAGTSINGLLKHDLVPDFLFPMTPFLLTTRLYNQLCRKVFPLFLVAPSKNDVVKNHVGPKAYFILSQDTLFSFLKGGLIPLRLLVMPLLLL